MTSHESFGSQEHQVLTAPHELRAIADPLRGIILQLLLERVATVSELTWAVGRPKSTVAHHVKVLGEAGMVRVVHPPGTGHRGALAWPHRPQHLRRPGAPRGRHPAAVAQ